ncbi:MAG TPA: maleylpyruvate isomerase N-terminal domain-containing protein [Methylomirabilota bacterium]|nr:maleylpyruvate isomerase N-terminal domain-containing protein [Methylomirabilota bacterium]
MAADRSYIAENDCERRRLEALAGKLDDAALSRALPAGWTVAGVLAHLAFWDQRIVLLVDLLKRGAAVPTEDPGHVDWINDAAKPTQLALPPRRAATLAVETARAADHAVATLSDELIAKNAAAGSPINLRRAQHRREHLDEIEQTLAG